MRAEFLHPPNAPGRCSPGRSAAPPSPSRSRAGRRVAGLAWLVWLWVIAIPSPAQTVETRNVLVHYSNGRLLPANVESDRALVERFGRRADLSVALASQFLDYPRFGGEACERAVAEFLREKYAAAPPRVLVAGGGDALEFWLRHRERIFPGVPVVHVGVGAARLDSLRPLPSDVVGIAVDDDVAGTLEQALRWHPAARRLVVVGDGSAWSREWDRHVRSQAARFADRLTVETLAGLPLAELQRRLQGLPRDAIVFTAGFFADGSGRHPTRARPRDSSPARRRRRSTGRIRPSSAPASSAAG